MNDHSPSALARLGGGVLLGHLPAGHGDFIAWASARAEGVLAVQAGEKTKAARWTEDAIAQADQGIAPYMLAQGVALIGVKGLIVPELGVIGWSWATGCAELCWQIEHALANDSVKGIALLVDSPGGYVSGVDEAATAIRAARAEKPIIAAVQDSAYSAAFWLASAADQISAPRMGGVGHIGTMTMHADYSGMFEKMGMQVTLLHSGARKVDAHPYQPLSDTARADIQSRLDAIRQVFAQSVADGRKGAITVDAVLATEAQAFIGPDGISDALSAGLIDAVIPADQAIGLFATHLADAVG